MSRKLEFHKQVPADGKNVVANDTGTGWWTDESWARSQYHAPQLKGDGLSEASGRTPPLLPAGDDRFNPKMRLAKGDQADGASVRVHVCDRERCKSVNRYWMQSCRFDGSYINRTWEAKTSPQELMQLWNSGKIDATWHCSSCQQKRGETLEETRERIGALQVAYRKKRTGR